MPEMSLLRIMGMQTQVIVHEFRSRCLKAKKFECRLIDENQTSTVNYKNYGSKKVLAEFC
jgi:hypothetical protein